MSTCQQKAVVLYKHGLGNTAVHLKVVTLQLMTAFGPLSIAGNIKCALQYIKLHSTLDFFVFVFGNHFYQGTNIANVCRYGEI